MGKVDLYQRATDQIITAIESGADGEEWKMPWTGFNNGLPYNATTKAVYRGVNVLMLWGAATGEAYPSNEWSSYKQWQGRGAQVNKGERGTIIVYCGSASREVENETGETEEKRFRFLKYSTVFNAAQVSGWESPETERPDLAKRIESAESFVANTEAVIRFGGGRALYTHTKDYIAMPDWDQFTDTKTATATENAYGTLLHELTHWTGHERRCDRKFSKRFGDQAYAMEELVAELGAAFLCAKIGITPAPRRDHAQYIARWLRTMKADKRAIFTAASKASDAVDFLNGLQAGEAVEAA